MCECKNPEREERESIAVQKSHPFFFTTKFDQFIVLVSYHFRWTMSVQGMGWIVMMGLMSCVKMLVFHKPSKGNSP